MKTHFTCRILYAEDHDDSSAMMKVWLGLASIEMVAAKTIAETWQLAQSGSFDLFLLDSDFPDGDGLELCRRLRRYASRTPIFFYSGRGYETDQKNGLAAGADEYLIKPYFDNLTEKILRAVELSQKKDDQINAKVKFFVLNSADTVEKVLWKFLFPRTVQSSVRRCLMRAKTSLSMLQIRALKSSRRSSFR